MHPTSSFDQAARPLVSILIGTYNAEAFIAETLESVLAQTYQDIEVVAVDDGSTDGTWGVLESFGTRIRAIRQDNGGIAAARNTALRAARGELIALMDHDDICEPERIAVQVRLLQVRPDVVLCSSEFSAFDAHGPIATDYSGVYYVRCAESEGGIKARFPFHGTLALDGCALGAAGSLACVEISHGDVYEEIALGNFVHPPTLLFRREVVDRAGWFEPTAGLMCDWDWLVRAARTGPFAFVHRPLLRYRRSATQVSSPRFHARSASDAMGISLRIRQADPDLFLRRRTAFQKSLGQMCLNASEVNVEHDRRLAAGLLVRSVFHCGIVNLQVVRAMLRIVTPSPVWRGMRRLRSRLVGARASFFTVHALWVDWDTFEVLERVASVAT